MASFKNVIERIQAVSPTISSEPLSGASHVPESWAVPTQCFSNAERKAREAGGGVLYGWMFQARELAAHPGFYCLLAINHAVWHAPDKKLIDVTPFHADQKHHPIVVNGDAVLFLIDNHAKPLKNEYTGLALPSWFIPLTDDPCVTAHVAELAAKELAG